MTTTLKPTILKRQLRQAIKAHNLKKDCSANDGWNESNGCGLNVTRKICRMVAQDKNGICGGHHITMKDCETWSHRMLPVGAGYQSQDTTPDIQPYVELLKQA